MRSLEKILKDHKKWLKNKQDNKRKLIYMLLSPEEQKLFKNADLQNADLSYSNLIGADLSNANLENAYLNSTYLRGANLRNANLESACLKNANLKHSNLTGANLKDTILNNANLENACLDFVNGLSFSERGLDIKLDKKMIYQYLYHLSSNSQHLELDNELRHLLTKYGNKWKGGKEYE